MVLKRILSSHSLLDRFPSSFCINAFNPKLWENRVQVNTLKHFKTLESVNTTKSCCVSQNKDYIFPQLFIWRRFQFSCCGKKSSNRIFQLMTETAFSH